MKSLIDIIIRKYAIEIIEKYKIENKCFESVRSDLKRIIIQILIELRKNVQGDKKGGRD